MRGGYVLTHRRVYENPVFKNRLEASIFIWMFTQAAWQETEVRYRNRIINLERGQLAYTLRDLERDWNIPRSSGQDFLKKLKNADMIRTDTRTNINVITICNYDKYQVLNDESRTSLGQCSGQSPDKPRTQNNEDNKIKEKKNTGTSSRTRKGETELEEHWQPNERAYAYGRAEGYTDEEIGWLADRFRNHWRAKGARKRDWHRTFLNWLSSSYSHRDIDQRRRSGAAVNGRSQPQASGRVAAIRRVAASVQQESERAHTGGLPGLEHERGRNSDTRGEPDACGRGDARAGVDGTVAADEGEGGRRGNGGYAGGAVHEPVERVPGGRGYSRLQVVGE